MQPRDFLGRFIAVLGAVVVGALVVTLAKWLYNNVGFVKTVVDKLGDGLNGIGNAIKDSFNSIKINVGDGLKNIGNGFKNSLNSLRKTVGKAFSNLKDSVGNKLQSVGNCIEDSLKFLRDGQIHKFDNIDIIRKGIENSLNSLKGVFGW